MITPPHRPSPRHQDPAMHQGTGPAPTPGPASPRRPRSRRLHSGLAVAALAALALTGCASGNAGSGPGTATASDAAGGSGTDGASGADAAPVAHGASQVNVTISAADGSGSCSLDHDSAAAGPVTFTITNRDAVAVSEVELLSDKRILGERENLVPGLRPGTFTVTLDGGTYQVYCPGAEPEKVDFTVTGQADDAGGGGDVAALLAEGTAGYARYVDGQVASLVDAVATLRDAIDSADLQAAREAYAQARPYYERIEPVAESFPKLDPALDARAGDLAAGEAWTGFHPIEQDLFADNAITGKTKQLAAGLQTNVAKLKELTADLSYRPEELANGASSLLEEVQSSKITGEEEAYSHIDLVDFAANVEGAQQAFEYLKPALKKIDKDLSQTIEAQFGHVTKALKGYVDPQALGGYERYTEQLRASDGAKLTHIIQDVQDPLARIAEKVATA